MTRKCDAPLCEETITVGAFKYFKDRLYSILHGGSFSAFYFCPEHSERMHGKDDGDPNTNPDMNQK